MCHVRLTLAINSIKTVLRMVFANCWRQQIMIHVNQKMHFRKRIYTTVEHRRRLSTLWLCYVNCNFFLQSVK